MRALHLPLAALLVAAVPAAASAADPTVLGTTSRATIAGAAGGWTAWSEVKGGRFALVVRAPDGTIARPAVATRGVPFDLDLGTDSKGVVVATYSRCAREPQRNGGANATAPQWASGRGCRLYNLDLATGAEHAYPRPRGGASQVLPSLGGNALAYVEVLAHPHGRAALVVRDLKSGRTRRLQRGGFRNGPPSIAGGPASVDTDGTRVAAIWRAVNRVWHSFDTSLRVTSVAGGKTFEAGGSSNNDVCNYDALVGGTLAGGTVTFLETNGSEWQSERAPTARRGRSTYGPVRAGDAPDKFDARGEYLTPELVTSAAVDGDRLVVSSTSGGQLGKPAGPTQIQEFALGTFTKRVPRVPEFCSP
jgi:hypothetical protein